MSTSPLYTPLRPHDEVLKLIRGLLIDQDKNIALAIGQVKRMSQGARILYAQWERMNIKHLSKVEEEKRSGKPIHEVGDGCVELKDDEIGIDERQIYKIYSTYVQKILPLKISQTKGARRIITSGTEAFVSSLGRSTYSEHIGAARKGGGKDENQLGGEEPMRV